MPNGACCPATPLMLMLMLMLYVQHIDDHGGGGRCLETLARRTNQGSAQEIIFEVETSLWLPTPPIRSSNDRLT